MSSGRNLRSRQLVADSNYPGKRVKRAITISGDRPDEQLVNSGQKVKKVVRQRRVALPENQSGREMFSQNISYIK